MKLAVLGATGRTGRLVVKAARARGHAVTALTRGRPGPDQSTLKWVRGDISSPRALRELVDGQDAVVSLLGPTKTASDVCSTATATLIGLGVSRLIVVSGAGTDAPGDQKDFIGRAVSYAVRKLSPSVFIDKQRELDLLVASKINWTAVRPPRLTDGKSGRPLRVGLVRSPGTKIERMTLAQFCVDIAEGNQFIQQAPFVAN
ncbi:MAG: NAD(P)H-binding protein [Devosia sp.]